jgi:hypothetical protein
MDPTPRAVLEALAAEVHAKTWEQWYIVRTVGYFEVHCRLRRQGRRVQLGATDAKENRLLLKVWCSSALNVAFGSHDPMVSATQPVGEVGGTPVLARRGQEAETSAWLGRDEVRAALAGIGMAGGEILTISMNDAELYAVPTEPAVVWERLDFLLALLDTLPPDPDRALHVTKKQVPPALWPALPLLRRWGLSDDQERGERIQAARTASLASLVAAVKPLWSALNAYLDSEPPEAGLRLGDLAQAAMEAERELNRRASARG